MRGVRGARASGYRSVHVCVGAAAAGGRGPGWAWVGGGGAAGPSWPMNWGPSVLSLGPGGPGFQVPLPGVQSARSASRASRPSLTGPRRPCPVLSGQVINNYLEASEPLSWEPRLSRMHFHDNQSKVDYVLVYQYRKRGAHPGHGSPGHSLAIVSNGETGKDPDAGAAGDIELGPFDALEEERKEQREEFEHNLVEAGLELEKDLEVRSGRCRGYGVGWLSRLGSCRKPWLCSGVWHCFFFSGGQTRFSCSRV